MTDQPVVVERRTTSRGELVLRRSGEDFEVISNGTFLMDTRNGTSERLLVRAALDAHEAPSTVLIGGLGIGFSLVEAVSDPRLTTIEVVEIEPAIVDWHRSHLEPYSAVAVTDHRTKIITADTAQHLRDTDRRYDAICLDIDNGPDWTVTPANSRLYDDAGTALIVSRLTPHGVLSVWSASRSPAYETTLHRHFAQVHVHEVTVQRGQPDVVIVATTPYFL